MKRLVYVSSAVNPFSEEELRALLQRARECNAKQQLTGLLLYHDSNFFQVLEGPDEAVTALEQKIRKDPRHRRMMLLLSESITERLFGDWSMGFKHVSELPPDQKVAFCDFLQDQQALHLGSVTGEAKIRSFLETFKTIVGLSDFKKAS